MLKQEVCSSDRDRIHPCEEQDLKAQYVEELFSTHLLLSKTVGSPRCSTALFQVTLLEVHLAKRRGKPSAELISRCFSS